MYAYAHMYICTQHMYTCTHTHKHTNVSICARSLSHSHTSWLMASLILAGGLRTTNSPTDQHALVHTNASSSLRVQIVVHRLDYRLQVGRHYSGHRTACLIRSPEVFPAADARGCV